MVGFCCRAKRSLLNLIHTGFTYLMKNQGARVRSGIPLRELRHTSLSWLLMLHTVNISGNCWSADQVTFSNWKLNFFTFSYAGKYTPQYKWLKAELARVNRSETPWLIVLMHSPMYNSYDKHYMEGETMRVMYESQFVEYKVDVIFAGHVHAYERSVILVFDGVSVFLVGVLDLTVRRRTQSQDLFLVSETCFEHCVRHSKRSMHASEEWIRPDLYNDWWWRKSWRLGNRVSTLIIFEPTFSYLDR